MFRIFKASGSKTSSQSILRARIECFLVLFVWNHKSYAQCLHGLFKIKDTYHVDVRVTTLEPSLPKSTNHGLCTFSNTDSKLWTFLFRDIQRYFMWTWDNSSHFWNCGLVPEGKWLKCILSRYSPWRLYSIHVKIPLWLYILQTCSLYIWAPIYCRTIAYWSKFLQTTFKDIILSSLPYLKLALWIWH